MNPYPLLFGGILHCVLGSIINDPAVTASGLALIWMGVAVIYGR
jgi:hypothetical protein